MSKETAVQTLVYSDGFIEEWEYNPYAKLMWDVKAAITINFTMREWEEYQSKKWVEKTLYLREKTLAVMNWTTSEVDRLVNKWV